MHYLDITIEDHVVPQLLTSALEAYEIHHTSGKRKEDKLETFGLIWGYVITEREDRRPRVVATFATVETSALRKNGSVEPSLDSLAMKIEFVKQYWPHMEVVGTFHSHPYASLEEVRACKGWQASSPDTVGKGQGDTVFWPWIHEKFFPTTPYLAHLILTIAKMDKKGWAIPKHIENDSCFELSMGRRKLWIASYATEIIYLDSEEDEEDEDDEEMVVEYKMMECQPSLDIPSLTLRVLQGN